MPPYDDPDVMLGKFLDAAYGQMGDKYRFGAHADHGDADPKAFDSSELVEWAAHRAGLTDMPDGSWDQYRYLHRQGGAVEVQEALDTPGALVFGFSSDPMASSGRPAQAYVGISVGDGKNVIDVSERAGEVKLLPAGDHYKYGAKIRGLHEMLPDSIEIDTDGDGIKDSSLRRPFWPGEIDTNGDGVPDSSVPDPPAYVPRQGRPDRLEMDRRTDEPGSGYDFDDWYELDDDPVSPSPGRSYGPRSQIDGDLPGGEEPDVAASYVAEPLPDDLAYHPTDGGAALPADPSPTVVAATTADASHLGADDVGYGASTYSDSYDDGSTDLPASA